MIQLSDVETRVLGSLMEKEATTPEQYPLTLNALTAACNQKTSRDPVMNVDPEKVLFALARLRDNRLVEERSESGNRAVRYLHNATTLAPLSPAEKAVLCVLLLRGPQTPGEIRGRTGRMHEFPDPAQVESVLNGLMTRFQEPLVEKLPKEPGRKERRYAHRLSGAPLRSEAALDKKPVPASTPDWEARLAALEERVAAVEARLAPPSNGESPIETGHEG